MMRILKFWFLGGGRVTDGVIRLISAQFDLVDKLSFDVKTECCIRLR